MYCQPRLEGREQKRKAKCKMKSVKCKVQSGEWKVNLSTPRPEGRGLLEVHPEPCFPTPP
jgi:hypothetical protein